MPSIQKLGCLGVPGWGSNRGPLLYIASWRAGHLLPNDDALGVPFGDDVGTVEVA